MPIALAPAPWPAAPTRSAAMRFAQVQGEGWRMELKRNLSLTPRQMGLAYGLLCLLSLVVAALFWWQGAGMVMLFTGVELLAVGVALLVAARHATDREVLTLQGREITVEQHVATLVRCTRFHADWLRVEPGAVPGSLVELSGQGRRVRIGRHLRPDLRMELARELRRIVQWMRAAPAVNNIEQRG